jgi:two-component system, OmpR family, heavy metal sensor histidine kinase CusS
LNISFRTRLFFIAAAIVGAVLALVLGLGWSRVLTAETDKLSDRLCMEARRIATRPFDAVELPRLEADVALKLRLGSVDQVMLRFEGHGDGNEIASPAWRSAPQPDGLVWAAARDSNGQGPREEGLPPPRLPQLQPPHSGPQPGRADAPPDRPRPREERPEGRPLDRPEGQARGRCSLAAFSHQGHDWQAARFEAPMGTAVLAADLASVKADLQSAVQRALTLIIPLALLLTAAGAWLMASLSLRPVNRLRNAMKSVTKNALDQRLPSAGEDREFKELIADYNTMLARLEASFHQASRFSADAAHEIKTPLTILQGRIEQAIGRSDNRAIQGDLTDMLDEVGRLATITRKLLWLSQADAGKLALQRAPVPLTELLDELMQDAQMLVTHQRVTSDIARGLSTQGDVMLLRQLFNNLLNNAVRYSPPNSWVSVRAVALPGGVEVQFTNASNEISAALRSRFFERFFRGDAAHNSQIEGSGLGLSLSREIARAHGGELTLEAGPLNEVTLRLWLPE